VTLPLLLLAIPSALIGIFTAGPMLFGTDWTGHVKQLPYFLGSIEVAPSHDVLARLAEEFHGPVMFALHGFMAPTFWLAYVGVDDINAATDKAKSLGATVFKGPSKSPATAG